MDERIKKFIFGIDRDIPNDEKVLNQSQRFDMIRSSCVDKTVWEYLDDTLKELKIEICGKHEGTVLNLMRRGLLEGWCWQTTESSIVFFNDNDYIERGNLVFDKYENYWHSWICFNYENTEYAFDPCLNLLSNKEVYNEVFETDVKGIVTAKQVREELINAMLSPKKKDSFVSKESEQAAEAFMKKFFGDSPEMERQIKERVIAGNDDVTSPMYRNNTGYIGKIENGKVKKLAAHYYMNG